MQTYPLTLTLAFDPGQQHVYGGFLDNADDQYQDVDRFPTVLFRSNDPLEVWRHLQSVGEALGVRVRISPEAKPMCEAALSDFLEAIK